MNAVEEAAQLDASQESLGDFDATRGIAKHHGKPLFPCLDQHLTLVRLRQFRRRGRVTLLREAGAVYLATVKEPGKGTKEPELPPVNGADYLSRHGISCEMIEVEAGDKGVSEALVAHAEHRKAGLIVMGAYGRTRLTERIFGGVTRKMLSDVRIPLLMTN